MKRLLLSSLMCLALSVSFAQQGKDPVALLKEANTYQQELFQKAQQGGGKIDFDAIQKQYADKVGEMLKDVDPNKIEGKDGVAWAQLYQAGGKHKVACDLLQRFLETKPADKERSQALTMMAQSCNELGEAEMLVQVLSDTPVLDAMGYQRLSSMTINQYTDTIFEKKGLDAAMAALDVVQKKALLEDPKDYAKRLLASRQRMQANAAVKKSDEVLLAELEKTGTEMNQIAALNFDLRRGELLAEAGKRKEGIELVSKSIAAVPAENPNLRTPKMKLRQMTLVGLGAPDLKFEKGINGATWPGIEGLKGKVVILDFFAHWCGPCIASFPDLKKMYADLNSKGLEIYHVTKYYGYYQRENTQLRDMPKDTEFSRMGDFVKQHELPWPVIYADPAFGEQYGIWGIPHCAVIDKNGVIHKIKVGYDAKSFANFRKEIEGLLGVN